MIDRSSIEAAIDFLIGDADKLPGEKKSAEKAPKNGKKGKIDLDDLPDLPDDDDLPDEDDDLLAPPPPKKVGKKLGSKGPIGRGGGRGSSPLDKYATLPLKIDNS